MGEYTGLNMRSTGTTGGAAISGGMKSGGLATMSTGRSGVSGGMRSASFGPSLSPEARFGGSTSKFSSRGLASFNRGPSMFKDASPKSPSMFSINRGKEVKSSHARTSSLARQRSMFDKSRSGFSVPKEGRRNEFGVKVNMQNGREKKSSHARTQNLINSRPFFGVPRSLDSHTSKPSFPRSEFGVRLNINNGRENRSNKARTVGLIPQRHMFDVSRPVRSDPIEKHTQRPVTREIMRRSPDRPKTNPYARRSSERRLSVAQRTREVGFNPRVRAERVKSVSPFKDTVILWQAKDVSPRLKLEVASRTARTPEARRRVRVEMRAPKPTTEVRSGIKRKIEIRPIRKTEKAKVQPRIKLGRVVRVAPDVSPEIKQVIYADIKHAQKKTIRTIMQARNVSYQVALQEVVQQLSKKHEGKVKVKTLVKPEIQRVIQVEPKTQTKAGVKTEMQTQTEAENETEKQLTVLQKEAENKASGNKPPEKKKTEKKKFFLFFKKDPVAGVRRENRFEEAYKRRLKYSKPGQEITSWDVLKEAGNPDKLEMSEITRPWNKDYRYGNFLYAVKLGASIFTNPKDFLTFVKFANHRHAAVKLAAQEGDAKGGDAMEVYGSSLENVNAYVSDMNLTGKLSADAKTKKVIVIKDGREQVHYVEAGYDNASYPQAA